MTHSTVLPSAADKPHYVNEMFARIAPTYDLMNRLMSGGQDQLWRRQLLAFCNLPPHGKLLDIGTGTGDLVAAAHEQYPTIQGYGADFTYEMMAVGRQQPLRQQIPFLQADTLALPYADHSFDAVVSGFLIRNVVDRAAAFREQARVTKPGGRVACLETTPPSNTVLGPLFSFYFFQLVPLIGGLISGDPQAYAYLPNSTVDFPKPPVLKHLMEDAGLQHVFYHEMMGGTVAIHVGTKVAR